MLSIPLSMYPIPLTSTDVKSSGPTLEVLGVCPHVVEKREAVFVEVQRQSMNEGVIGVIDKFFRGLFVRRRHLYRALRSALLQPLNIDLIVYDLQDAWGFF